MKFIGTSKAWSRLRRTAASRLAVWRVPEPRPPRNTPYRGLEISGDDLEDWRFAGAVAPDDAPTFALADSEGDVLEKLGGAEGDADLRDGKKGHAGTGEDQEEALAARCAR